MLHVIQHAGNIPLKTSSVVTSFRVIVLSFLQHIMTRIVVERMVLTRNTPVVTPRIITYCFRGMGVVAIAIVTVVKGGVTLGWLLGRVDVGRSVVLAGGL